jgi:signal transduction histidine kinase
MADTDVEIDVEAPDQALHGDRIGLRHVLVNLISNAVKYGERSPRRITVAACRVSATDRGHTVIESFDPDDDSVAVCVTDNGIGIEPEHHEAIFAIFRRLHARDAYGGGTGAGLTIARRIVERHGGALWLDRSAPGEGSTLCFTVPAR